MQIVDVRFICVIFSRNKIINHARLQRPGTEQCDQRDEIVEVIGLHAVHEVTHAPRLKLKDGRRAASPQHFEGLCVRQRNVCDIQVQLGLFRIDDLHRPINDGQRFQPQKIELDEPGSFHVVLVQLGDDVFTAFFAIERCEVGQLVRCDNDTARVLTRIPDEAFE